MFKHTPHKFVYFYAELCNSSKPKLTFLTEANSQKTTNLNCRC